MPEAWRLVKQKHAETAFSGEGASKYGGRWNSRGIPVVYASGSLSLAILETLVHLNPPMPFVYAVFRVEMEEALIQKISPANLPPDWRVSPAGKGSQSVGDAWSRASRSPVLQVSSVIVAGEFNYLFNPAHPDFKRLSIDKAAPFSLDPRLRR